MSGRLKLLDTNVWLALVVGPHPLHVPAENWFSVQTGTRNHVFCRATQQSFLRLLTTESVLRGYGMPALTNAGAWRQFEQLLNDARVGFAEEPPGLEAHWKAFTNRNTASPKIWMDAYLAAFAVAGGHQLITTDKGFAQYTGLDFHLIS